MIPPGGVLGDVVAVEPTIQGAFTDPFETPPAVIQPTGAKLGIPTAEFRYIEDRKTKEFNCHVGLGVMLAQTGVLPDFASAALTRPVPQHDGGHRCCPVGPEEAVRLDAAPAGRVRWISAESTE